jgi:hypothetical protein
MNAFAGLEPSGVQDIEAPRHDLSTSRGNESVDVHTEWDDADARVRGVDCGD